MRASRAVIGQRTLFAAAVRPTWPATVTAVLAGSALVAGAAQLRIDLPFSPVPVTGQTFAVLLVGAALGARLGRRRSPRTSPRASRACRCSRAARRPGRRAPSRA